MLLCKVSNRNFSNFILYATIDAEESKNCSDICICIYHRNLPVGTPNSWSKCQVFIYTYMYKYKYACRYLQPYFRLNTVHMPIKSHLFVWHWFSIIPLTVFLITLNVSPKRVVCGAGSCGLVACAAYLSFYLFVNQQSLAQRSTAFKKCFEHIFMHTYTLAINFLFLKIVKKMFNKSNYA